MEFQFKNTSDSLAWEVILNGDLIGKVSYDEYYECYRQSGDTYIQKYESRIEAAKGLKSFLP